LLLWRTKLSELEDVKILSDYIEKRSINKNFDYRATDEYETLLKKAVDSGRDIKKSFSNISKSNKPNKVTINPLSGDGISIKEKEGTNNILITNTTRLYLSAEVVTKDGYCYSRNLLKMVFGH